MALFLYGIYLLVPSCCHPVHDGVGQTALGGLGVGEAGLEGVAEGHELVDFGDDAVLFGQRRDWNIQFFHITNP